MKHGVSNDTVSVKLKLGSGVTTGSGNGGSPQQAAAAAARFWALTICKHCRDFSTSTGVFACYGTKAHHREVVLVDAEGARDSVGILSTGSEQRLIENNILPAGRREEGKIADLDPDSSLQADDDIYCVISCEQCAGFPLGYCMDEGHTQQVRCVNKLPAKAARRRARPPPTPPKRKTVTTPTRVRSSTKKTAAGKRGGVSEAKKPAGDNSSSSSVGSGGGGEIEGRNGTAIAAAAGSQACTGARGQKSGVADDKSAVFRGVPRATSTAVGAGGTQDADGESVAAGTPVGRAGQTSKGTGGVAGADGLGEGGVEQDGCRSAENKTNGGERAVRGTKRPREPPPPSPLPEGTNGAVGESKQPQPPSSSVPPAPSSDEQREKRSGKVVGTEEEGEIDVAGPSDQALKRARVVVSGRLPGAAAAATVAGSVVSAAAATTAAAVNEAPTVANACASADAAVPSALFVRQQLSDANPEPLAEPGSNRTAASSGGGLEHVNAAVSNGEEERSVSSGGAMPVACAVQREEDRDVGGDGKTSSREGTTSLGCRSGDRRKDRVENGGDGSGGTTVGTAPCPPAPSAVRKTIDVGVGGSPPEENEASPPPPPPLSPSLSSSSLNSLSVAGRAVPLPPAGILPLSSPPLVPAVTEKASRERRATAFPSPGNTAAAAAAAAAANGAGAGSVLCGRESDAAGSTSSPSSASSSCSSSSSSASSTDVVVGNVSRRTATGGRRGRANTRKRAAKKKKEKKEDGVEQRGVVSVAEDAAAAAAAAAVRTVAAGGVEPRRACGASTVVASAGDTAACAATFGAASAAAVAGCSAASAAGGATSAATATGAATAVGSSGEIARTRSPSPLPSTKSIIQGAAAAAGTKQQGLVDKVAQERSIELAKFEEVQRRIYAQAQQACREEIAPLEAELERKKQVLRKRMQGARDAWDREREAFCASLFGVGSAAVAAASGTGGS